MWLSIIYYTPLREIANSFDFFGLGLDPGFICSVFSLDGLIKMLLGIDLPRVDIVIFLRPYNQLSALVQGGGRGGRRMENGKRRRVQVYQFFNSQDFTRQNQLMSPDMRRICVSEECTRDLLRDYFAGDCKPNEKPDEESSHCCHNCDLKK